MISVEKINASEKEILPSLIPALEAEDIAQLVSWLSEKDDNFRYKCLLLLLERSQGYGDVYPYWDIFVEKLGNPNSYQRSIGLMLLAENARWDHDSKFDSILDSYLFACDDEKPVTVRQCIQGLLKIIPYKKNCYSRIIDKLLSIDLMQRKETQRKLLLLDILSVLSAIHRIQPNERITRYLQNAISGDILDSKSKRAITML
jgi:hypothetical protein